LTYGFAFAAFWSAAAVAEVPFPAPLEKPGAVKGLILRHLRWWAKKTDIFNTDGTLNIGYTYPNMYMSEDYNSPQSVYWCLKTFSVLALSASHSFWTCEELPDPLSTQAQDVAEEKGQSPLLERIAVVEPAMQIICSTKQHHFFLSAGQFTKKTHKAREAKYSKFAYSSAFAFSVPTGSLLPQLAPDSTLSVSDDGGETWRVRWEPLEARIQDMASSFEADGAAVTISRPCLRSAWRPWRNSSLKIETTLVPSLDRWPGWHIRVHEVAGSHLQTIQCVDAGFAISRLSKKGGNLPVLNTNLSLNTGSAAEEVDNVAGEGLWQEEAACLVLSDAGASGICDLTGQIKQPSPRDRGTGNHASKGLMLNPDANTNLIAQRTLIPTIQHEFEESIGKTNGGNDEIEQSTWFVTGVFAIAASAGLSAQEIRSLWRDKPRFKIE